MKPPTQTEITRASLRVTAAQTLKEAKQQEFMAACMNATPREIERSRLNFIAACEGWSDAMHANFRMLKMSMGLDPDAVC